MSITIYHNPACSKSRQTLEILESHGINPTIVKYLETPPAAETLIDLANRLGVELAALVRTGEQVVKDAGDDVPMQDAEALAAWINDHPRALQRPIVVDDASGKAVVGRPPENVLELIDS